MRTRRRERRAGHHACRHCAAAVLFAHIVLCAHPAAAGWRWGPADAPPGENALPERWSARVYDVELFDAAGLRSFGGDVAVRVGSIAAGAGLDRTGASVGSVSTWSVCGGVVFGNQGALVATVAHEVVALGTVSSSTSAGVRAWLAVTPRVAIRTCVHGIRMAGTGDPGADLDASVDITPARFLAVALGLSIDRRYGASPSVALTARLGAPLDVVVGFDEASATVYGGLAVRAAAVRVAASVWSHELLGFSRGVSLAWGR